MAKHPSKSVETVTSNEQFVRMMIYDGDLPVDAAKDELLRIERSQNEALRAELREVYARFGQA